MCGILGCSHLTPTTRAMLPFLAWEMQHRGRDSWGATNGGPDETDTIHRLGAIRGTWHLPDSWNRAIVHTRAASVGAATLPNAHPFTYHGSRGRVIGIHNGHINNHVELAHRYPDRNFEVDSMHIFRHIADGLDLSELEGWGAVAWYQTDLDGPYASPDAVLHLGRFNMTDLTVARLNTGEIVFCSLEAPIADAAAMCGSGIKTIYRLHENRLYTIALDTTNDWAIFQSTENTLPFGPRYRTVVSHPATYPAGNDVHGTDTSRRWDREQDWWHRKATVSETTVGEPDRTTGLCAKTSCRNRVLDSRKRNVLCTEHLLEIVDRLQRQGHKFSPSSHGQIPTIDFEVVTK